VSSGVPDELRVATAALADALVRAWRACDTPRRRPDGSTFAAGNLPEQLSYALGLAAKRLGALGDDDRTGEAAGALLVRHRPGSWEAQHVVALVLPPDLIDSE